MPEWFDSLLKDELSRLDELHQLRHRRIVKPIDAVRAEIDGRICINFCSNNYLGLTHHPRVIAAVKSGAEKSGAGAGAAGLISGFFPEHAAAESAIAAWKETESAILLPSGYQANHAAIQTLAALGKHRSAGVRFLVDKLAHASLLDAIRGCEMPWRVFPHNGMKKLSRLLDEANADQLQVVVTESIFSMDGDTADLAALHQMKQEKPFVLLLDEAHAGGVYGPNGAGLAAELGLSKMVDLFVVTLSKAIGCVGGAVCGSDDLCQAVLNRGRAYIYSTSIAPAIAAGIAEAIAVMRDEPQHQRRLREISRNFREQLRARGLAIPVGDSPIVPIILGEETAAMELASKLLEHDLLIGAVRPPTVPRGTSRLRVTLSCEHADDQIDRLVQILDQQMISKDSAPTPGHIETPAP